MKTNVFKNGLWRKIVNLSFISLGMIFLCSCPDPEVVSVSPKSLEFEAKINDEYPEQKNVNIETNADTWEIFNSSGWIKADKVDEETMSVSVIQTWTRTNEGREAKIMIKAGSATDTVLVRQKAKIKDNLSVNPPSLTYEAAETGDKTVTVTTNAPEWSAVKPGDATWLNIEKINNNLIVKVPSANTQIAPRNADITISGGDADAVTLTVTQGAAAPYITASPPSLGFGYDETASKPVTVSTNVAEWSALPGSSWITVSKSGNTLSVSVERNGGTTERDANITLTAGNAPPATVKVTQAAVIPTLSVNPPSLSFTADETGPKTLSVTTNQSDWSASKLASVTWLDVVYNKSTNTITVTVTRNTSSSPRSADITVNAVLATPVTVTVTQTGATAPTPSLSVSPPSLSFTASETTAKTLTVTTNQSSWNATKSVTWIQATLYTSTNTISVTANSNTGTSPRSGSITVTAGNATPVSVTVTQAGATTPTGPCFGNMPAGSYSATGTPSWAADPGPGSWAGAVTLNCAGLYYSISNWAGVSLNAFCDYINGKIILDNKTKLTTISGYDIYFKALVRNPSGGWYDLSDYEVRYNTSTRTLDFSGTVGGYSVMVGFTALDPGTGNLYGVITDLYANARLVLTPTTSSAPYSGDAVLKSEIRQAPGNLKLTPVEDGSVVLKSISAKSLPK